MIKNEEQIINTSNNILEDTINIKQLNNISKEEKYIQILRLVINIISLFLLQYLSML